MHTPRKAAPLLGLSTLVMLGLTAALPRSVAAQVKITASITGTAPRLAANQDALNFLASDFQTNGTPTFAMTASIQWIDLGFPSGGYLTPSPLELAMMQDIGWHTVGAPVPEASSSISLSILLALGLGGEVIARKRKAAGKAA